MSKSVDILVVDDDAEIRRVIETYLTQQGYRVSTANDGKRLREILARRSVDLVILDLVLPGEDGLQIARALRSESDIGIIMLTGKGKVVDRVVGLEIGADDYLTKPFSLRELLARVRSVLRRQIRVPAGVDSLSPTSAAFAGWRLDFNSRKLSAPDGRDVTLTTAEFRLLVVLVKSPHQPVKRDRLLELVAQRQWTPEDRSIDVLIGKLRQKIESDPKHPALIKTERGAGYVFSADVELS